MKTGKEVVILSVDEKEFLYLVGKKGVIISIDNKKLYSYQIRLESGEIVWVAPTQVRSI